MNAVHKEALCINCGCCVSECNAMESDPEFLGPQALAKGMRFVGDPRDGATVERLEEYSGEHGIWECTRCFFCNERCPKGVDPRDAIAKLGAEAIKEGVDRDMGAKHAKWFIRSTETTGWLRETELVPKTQGVVSSVKQMKFAMKLITAQQGRASRSRRTSRPTSARRARCTSSCSEQDRLGYASVTCRASTRSRSSCTATRKAAIRTGRGRSRGRTCRTMSRRARGRGSVSTVEGMKRVAYYKGCLASLSAKELDTSTQALAPRVGLELIELESVTCCGAGDIHEAEPDYYLHLNARILAYAEAGRVRHAAHRLQRLHAQPAPGELHAEGRRKPARPHQREPEVGRRARVPRRRSRFGTCSGRSPRATATRS